MKQLTFSLLILLCLLALIPPATTEAGPPRPDCTPQNAYDWLELRKGYLNAATDLAQAAADEELTPLQVSILMDELSAGLFSKPRPECADEAMLWTYFVLSSFSEVYACLEGNWQCYNHAVARAQVYKEVGVPTVIVPLEEFAGYDPNDPALTEVRPPGWNIEDVIAASQPPETVKPSEGPAA